MSFQLPIRNCGRFKYWGATLDMPNGAYIYINEPTFSNGVAEHSCAKGQRGHERELNAGWTFGSDKCGKWEAKPT